MELSKIISKKRTYPGVGLALVSPIADRVLFKKIQMTQKCKKVWISIDIDSLITNLPKLCQLFNFFLFKVEQFSKLQKVKRLDILTSPLALLNLYTLSNMAAEYTEKVKIKLKDKTLIYTDLMPLMTSFVLFLFSVFIFSHFDWICCNRTEGMCMYVCAYVCGCVYLSVYVSATSNFTAILMTFCTGERSVFSCFFFYFLFRIGWRNVGHFALFWPAWSWS